MKDLLEDRKQWNRPISQFDAITPLCVHCGGPMEETVGYFPDPVGTIYDLVCKNPDCPLRN